MHDRTQSGKKSASELKLGSGSESFTPVRQSRQKQVERGQVEIKRLDSVWLLRRCVIDCPLRQETVEAEAYLAQKKVNVTWLVTDKKERANSPTKKARIDANGTSPGLILKRKQLRSSTVSNTAETPAAKPGVDCRDMVRNHSRSRFPCGGLSLRTNSTCFASRVTGFVSQ